MNTWITQHDTHLEEIETCTSSVEDLLQTQGKRVKKLEMELLHVAAKAEDFEVWAWRNTIHIIGVAEMTDTGPKTHYVEQLLIKLFTKEHISTSVMVERAHRSLGPRPPVGVPP